MKKVLIAGRSTLSENYSNAILGINAEPTVSIDITDIRAFDGLLIPGGDDINPALYCEENTDSRNIDDALDTAQLRIIDLFVRAKKPILGICRGHQMLNIYFGGSLIQNLPTWEVHARHGADAIHLTHASRDCYLTSLYGSTDFVTNSSHHQAVKKLGSGLVAIQYHDDVVEAFIHESLPIIALQWHPERMAYARRREDTVDGARIFEYFDSMMDRNIKNTL